MCTVTDVQEGAIFALRAGGVTLRVVVLRLIDSSIVSYKLDSSGEVRELPLLDFVERAMGGPFAISP
jgi:hypothetical protein